MLLLLTSQVKVQGQGEEEAGWERVTNAWNWRRHCKAVWFDLDLKYRNKWSPSSPRRLTYLLPTRTHERVAIKGSWFSAESKDIIKKIPLQGAALGVVIRRDSSVTEPRWSWRSRLLWEVTPPGFSQLLDSFQLLRRERLKVVTEASPCNTQRRWEPSLEGFRFSFMAVVSGLSYTLFRICSEDISLSSQSLVWFSFYLM